jgi:hypothetical protein
MPAQQTPSHQLLSILHLVLVLLSALPQVKKQLRKVLTSGHYVRPLRCPEE